MKVKLYGTGCAKCNALYDNARKALDFAGVDAEIEKVTDLQNIAQAGILSTPALEIDGRVLFSGEVPTPQEIVEVLPEEECSGGTKASSCCCGKKSVPEKQEPPTPGCCCCGGKKERPALPRRLLAYLLLTFVGVAVAIMALRETRPAAPPESDASPVQDTAAIPEQDTMTVYYFHGNQRSATCLKFEALTKEVLEADYAQELGEGRLRFLPVNVEEASNAHFFRDFNLTSQSIVLSTPSAFRNLDQIWMVIFRGDEAFKAYLRKNLREMREQAP